MPFFKKKQKTVIITIHGFGRNVKHEFDPFVEYVDSKRFEIVQFNMYDPYDPKDDNHTKWINKAETVMNQYRHQEIILLGFSMGGVIASYLASIYKVKKLILIAPAFQYLDLSIITQHGVKLVKNINKKTEQIPSASQTKAFQTIVSKYKESIQQVDCPVFIFQGTSDEVIPLESSKNAYKKIHGPKRLIFIEGGKHRIMYDGKMEKCIFNLILDAINDNLL